MFQPWTPTHKECSNYLVRGPHRRNAALLVDGVGDRVELGLALGGDLAAPEKVKIKRHKMLMSDHNQLHKNQASRSAICKEERQKTPRADALVGRLDQAELLERLQRGANHAGRRLAVVLRHCAVVLGAAKHLGVRADTAVREQVHLACERGWQEGCGKRKTREHTRCENKLSIDVASANWLK